MSSNENLEAEVISDKQPEYGIPTTWGKFTSEGSAELAAIFERSARSYHIDVERLLGFYESAFIAQLRYLLKNSGRVRIIQDDKGRRWKGYYNSYEQWKAHLPTMTRSRLRRIIARLERLDILYTKRGPYQKWYGLNFKALLFYLKNPEAVQQNEKNC